MLPVFGPFPGINRLPGLLFKKVLCAGIAAGFILCGIPAFSLHASADELLVPETFIVDEEGTEDVKAEAEVRLTIEPESNRFENGNWPEGPFISAESAIVMEASTGTVLYAKNMHEKLYPASTTKLLTALIAYECLPADSMIYYSETAVNSVPADGSSIGIEPGESLNLEDTLYGVMLASANEGANALGEAVSGSAEAFADKMNEYAAALGCEDSHFITASGLHENGHYTTAYDLALISRKYFSYDYLCRIASAAHYHIPPSDTQPDDLLINNTNSFATGDLICLGFIGGKTGYTKNARSCLVTCSERNGMKLICVVLREEAPEQYMDTVSLLKYCAASFGTKPLDTIIHSPGASEIQGIPDISHTESFFSSVQRMDIIPALSRDYSDDSGSSLVLINDQPLSDIRCSKAFGITEEIPGSIAELTFDVNGSSAKAYLTYTPLDSADLKISSLLGTADYPVGSKKKADTGNFSPASAITRFISKITGFFVLSFGNVTYVNIPHLVIFSAVILGIIAAAVIIIRILKGFYFGRRIY